jgi:hypothetical protein
MARGLSGLSRTRRFFSIYPLFAAFVAALLLAAGCGSKTKVHPALILTDQQQIEEATKRGIRMINGGVDPYTLFGKTTREINERLGGGVIVRSVSLCLPQDELTFRVVMAGDPSDEGAKAAADAALQQINRQVRFTTVLQIAKTTRPEDVEFELLTIGGKPYPPVAVEPPEFIAEVPAYDANSPAAAVYGYNIYFPTTGSPGFPAIGEGTMTLTLVTKAEGASTKVAFNLSKDTRR